MSFYRYRVQGRGEFPLDMLRYDQARFTTPYERVIADEGRELRVIQIDGPRRPTENRWASFGWTVIDTVGMSGELPDLAPAGADKPVSSVEAW